MTAVDHGQVDHGHGEGLVLDLPLGGTVLPLDGLHPHHEDVREQHDRWFAERLTGPELAAVQRHADRTDAVGLVTRTAPSADLAYLVDAAVFTTSAFLMDDVLEDPDVPAPLIDAVMAATQGAGFTEGPTELRIWDGALEQIKGSLGSLYPRHRGAVLEWVRCQAGTGVSLPQTPTLPAYLRYRSTDSGFDCLRVSVQRTSGVVLGWGPHRQELENFHDACTTHGSLVNDLFSFRKERNDPAAVNAIKVLQRTEGLTLQAAVDKVCELIRRAEREIEHFVRSLDDGHEARALRAYALGWWEVAGGHLAWTLSNARYHGPGHVWDGTVPTGMALYQDRTVLLSA